MPQPGTSVAIAPWNRDTVAFLVVIRRQQWRTALTHDPPRGMRGPWHSAPG